MTTPPVATPLLPRVLPAEDELDVQDPDDDHEQQDRDDLEDSEPEVPHLGREQGRMHGG